MAELGYHPGGTPTDGQVQTGVRPWALMKVQATENGTLTSASIYLDSDTGVSQRFTLGIWDDAVGVPGARVGDTAEGLTSGNAEWQTLTFDGTPGIVSGNFYWIGVAVGDGTFYTGNDLTANDTYHKAGSYVSGEVPDPFPASSTLLTAYKWWIYVTYTGGESVLISSPVANVVLQRDEVTGLADIVISGTYSGSPTAIEASFNGAAYTTIDASPSAEIFSATLTDQIAGQGTLTVRFTNDTGVLSTVALLGIGDRFLVIGDSISEGRGTNAQVHGHATLVPIVFRQDDARIEADDPVDSGGTGTLIGSHWPLLLRHIMDDQAVPVEIVTCGRGSTDVAGSLDTWAKPNAEFTEMISQAAAAGGTYRGILCHWGPNAITSNLTQVTYNAAIDQFITDVQSDVQAGLKLYLGIFGEVTSVSGTIDTLRAAILEAVADNDSMGYGPNLIEHSYVDGVHPKTDVLLQEVADRWWAALNDQLYGGNNGRGPLLTSIATSGAVATVGFNQSLVEASYTVGAFTLSDGSGTRTITGVVKSGARTIAITVSGADLVAPLEVSFGQDNKALGAVVPTGVAYTLPNASTINLPTEPFYAEGIQSLPVPPLDNPDPIYIPKHIKSIRITASFTGNITYIDGTNEEFSASLDDKGVISVEGQGHASQALYRLLRDEDWLENMFALLPGTITLDPPVIINNSVTGLVSKLCGQISYPDDTVGSFSVLYDGAISFLSDPDSGVHWGAAINNDNTRVWLEALFEVVSGSATITP